VKNYVDGGEAVVQAFRALDVDYVMASPGSEWGSVWEAFARQKVSNTKGPTYFSCAHETLAVDLAIGYTAYTGRMQAVMLHTGVGLLQGAMGIDAAQRQGIPMVIVSGESLTYGEREGFEPGPQWQSSLSVVGGPYRLAEPITKWAYKATSTETLFPQLVAAGEMAQRTPAGPVYMSVPIETQLGDWTPPADVRNVPPAPKPVPAAADIERVAALLAKAKKPVVVAEASGRDVEGYDALVELAELLSIAVVEPRWSDYANFPKDHPLHLGAGRPDCLDEADLILTVRSRSPWYPSNKRPANATVVAIDETPFKPHLVMHISDADIFLEGDAALTMKALAEAVGAAGIDKSAVEARGKEWAKAHDALVAKNKAATDADQAKKSITPLALISTLGEALPEDTIYVDETITHRGIMLAHLQNKGPQSYFRVQGGLGQGLGVALGVKMAAKDSTQDRPVALVIGDGSFMYNPVLQSLALSQHAGLPILIVVNNNAGYVAMQKEHHAYYPDGVAAANDIFYGRPLTDLEYSDLPKLFGGFGKRVETMAELPGALQEGMAAVKEGRSAIINVMLEDTPKRD